MDEEKKFHFTDEDFAEAGEVLLADLNFLQEIINNFQEELGPDFKEITDIKLENLKDFLIPILRIFSEERLSVLEVEDIGDALHTYLYMRYPQHSLNSFYPGFGEEHPLRVSLNVVSVLGGRFPNYIIFPEDAASFIEMLQSPPEKAFETNQKMYVFVRQFDEMERYHEGKRRGLFDKV